MAKYRGEIGFTVLLTIDTDDVEHYNWYVDPALLQDHSVALCMLDMDVLNMDPHELMACADDIRTEIFGVTKLGDS